MEGGEGGTGRAPGRGGARNDGAGREGVGHEEAMSAAPDGGVPQGITRGSGRPVPAPVTAKVLPWPCGAPPSMSCAALVQ
ncbi:hypothetical protein PMES_03152 [Profundibacterium mesophilum KAUST100406-0324]|uniref:Uncharacterized protein n=1 Tax=Profundibacterium mesophilum KAUST100406-0324 TaxID=1037889 RepID=A0A921TC17_9RHOB|nr:hypothetical protein PMES_03152 [Profundibacterium mesophilum KAUST100406-0324]